MRRVFHLIERRSDLGHLTIDPLRRSDLVATAGILIAREQRRIEQTIAERLLGEHLPALRPARKQRTVSEVVEIFANHPAVEQQRTIRQLRRRHLGERVETCDPRVALERMRCTRQPHDAIGDPQLDRTGHHLADIGRCRRVEQFDLVAHGF
jgi:hypothetical protein